MRINRVESVVSRTIDEGCEGMNSINRGQTVDGLAKTSTRMITDSAVIVGNGVELLLTYNIL